MLIVFILLGFQSYCKSEEKGLSVEEYLASYLLLSSGANSKNMDPVLLSILSDAMPEGLFVAVGDNGRTLTTSDGINWENENTITDYHLNGIAYGFNRFVAVGSSGKMHTTDGGLTWIAEGKQNDRLIDVIFAEDRFVAAGEAGRRVISRDGVNWNNDIVSGSTLNALAHGNVNITVDGITDNYSVIYAGGFSARLTRSTTGGANWKNYTLNSSSEILGMTYNPITSEFMAVGQNGLIANSTDGETWSVIQEDNSEKLNDIIYTPSGYITVGINGRILSSYNGQSWTIIDPGLNFNDTLFSITYGNGSYVAVGINGRRIHSNDAVNWTVTGTGGFSLRDVEFVDGFSTDTSGNWDQVCHTHVHVHDNIADLRHSHWHCHSQTERKNIHNHPHD